MLASAWMSFDATVRQFIQKAREISLTIGQQHRPVVAGINITIPILWPQKSHDTTMIMDRAS